MRVIVCGGRDYMDFDAVINALDALHKKKTITMVIEGGAKGADAHAAVWDDQNKISRVTCHANWKHLGSYAGPARNKIMLTLLPEGVVAFPGGTGASGMVKLAQEAGITVWEPCK